MFYGEIGLLCSRSRAQQNFKMSVNVCLDYIFWITEHSVTKFGMVMQHHEPECHAEILLLLLLSLRSKSQWGSYDQNMTLSTIFSELLIAWQPNLVWWYIIISQSVLWKKRIIAFKVKVTVKGQNVSVCPDDIFQTTEHLFPNLVLWCITVSRRAC